MYIILKQNKNYISRNICNTLDNRKFLNQNLMSAYFLFEIPIVLGTTRVTDAYRESLKTGRCLWCLSKESEDHHLGACDI